MIFLKIISFKKYENHNIISIKNISLSIFQNIKNLILNRFKFNLKVFKEIWDKLNILVNLYL
jgi:hypothetical protein